MNRIILELILNQNTQSLLDIYQYANNEYFVAFIDDNQKQMNYYKEVITNIENELRTRKYWRG